MSALNATVKGNFYDPAQPPDRADTVRRGQRNPLRLSPLRQARRRAYRLQPALHRHDGLLGPGGDGWLGILFDNAGVSSSSGEVPATFEEMGADAIAFI